MRRNIPLISKRYFICRDTTEREIVYFAAFFPAFGPIDPKRRHLRLAGKGDTINLESLN
jgi:hypothetical protein